MNVAIRPARSRDKTLIDNLMQLYLHDFSAFYATDAIDDEGRFSYPYLAHYWEDPHRYAFLILCDDKVAGFILARFLSDPATGSGAMEVAEFFVLRSYRRRGVGAVAASKLWDMFPGQWHLSVMTDNLGGFAFWKPTIAAYTGDQLREETIRSRGIERVIYSFASRSEFDPPPDLDIETVDY